VAIHLGRNARERVDVFHNALIEIRQVGVACQNVAFVEMIA
jgi:hypothetical protein